MLDLTNKVAIVTGAGSVGPGWGNGRATATLLARQGASVFLIDRNRAAVEETAAGIRAEDKICDVHLCDMLDSSDVAAMIAACVARFGRLDILVNNVGGSEPGDAAEMSEETWDHQIDYNLKTVFLGCKHALPVMAQQASGAIVNIASVAGLRNIGGRAHIGYNASKAGVIQFSRATAGTYASRGVRCNTVVPGLMHTPLVEHRLLRQLAGNDAEALIASRAAQVPMGRMGTGWDVANAVLFLVSAEAGYITGTEIVVDGGYIAAGH